MVGGHVPLPASCARKWVGGRALEIGWVGTSLCPLPEKREETGRGTCPSTWGGTPTSRGTCSSTWNGRRTGRGTCLSTWD